MRSHTCLAVNLPSDSHCISSHMLLSFHRCTGGQRQWEKQLELRPGWEIWGIVGSVRLVAVEGVCLKCSNIKPLLTMTGIPQGRRIKEPGNSGIVWASVSGSLQRPHGTGPHLSPVATGQARQTHLSWTLAQVKRVNRTSVHLWKHQLYTHWAVKNIEILECNPDTVAYLQ